MSTGTDGIGTGSGSGEVLAIGPLAAPDLHLAAPNPRNTQVGEGIKLGPLRKDLADDNVSAPAAQVPALRELVAQGKKDGHDLHFVVLTERQPVFTNYRDIATALQKDTSGTVIVIGPNAVGSASDEFSRVTLEQATDNLKFADQTQAARQMYDKMTEPSINWTVATLVLIVVVVIGAVAARVLGSRKGEVSGAQSDTGSQNADAGDSVVVGAGDAPSSDPGSATD
ncbi:hypothetical protein M2359_002770 [Gordonia amarae]|uniref:Uncharacterized protein n=1 Tax=Gordonia amarae NBRC 15530 TaxID=1075090 RepID=G7GJB1_9ACTN|nr:DUF6676 family protein [Gordonia amarae]MCS3879141.1 hypothetical protein [Gordonia amarae]GAB03686.1 hypothetical protein GOAMR_04_00030 [Gordonia amarae NBRC 15530]